MGSNREKSNIASAILEKLPFLKGNKNFVPGMCQSCDIDLGYPDAMASLLNFQ